MKIRFLLLGTSLSLIPNLTSAQCVATQDCATLGYTETSCSGGSGVKCPFGNKWACFKSESEVCEKYGFTNACTSTNQIGVGKPCNGKYSECTCTSGYEWKDGSCKIQDGAHGDLYYCNGTVVAIKASGMNFYIAIKDLERNDWYNARRSCENYVFCGNLKGTLPSRAQLLTIYNNKSTINSLLSVNGGTQLTNNWYWSSTFDSNKDYNFYVVYMSSGNASSNYYTSNHYVRPVLASY